MRNPLISAIAHPWLRAVVFARARIDPEFKLENIPDEYFSKHANMLKGIINLFKLTIILYGRLAITCIEESENM